MASRNGEFDSAIFPVAALAKTIVARIAFDTGATSINGIAGALEGVLDQDVPAGGRGDIQVTGRVAVIAGVAIPVRSQITAGAGGKAVIAVAGDWVLGVAVTAALAVNDQFDIRIERYKI